MPEWTWTEGRAADEKPKTKIQIAAEKARQKFEDQLAEFSKEVKDAGLGMNTSSSETVGNRLDRIKPPANKWRPKLLALLSKPRHIAKLELITAA